MSMNIPLGPPLSLPEGINAGIKVSASDITDRRKRPDGEIAMGPPNIELIIESQAKRDSWTFVAKVTTSTVLNFESQKFGGEVGAQFDYYHQATDTDFVFMATYGGTTNGSFQLFEQQMNIGVGAKKSNGDMLKLGLGLKPVGDEMDLTASFSVELLSW